MKKANVMEIAKISQGFERVETTTHDLKIERGLAIKEVVKIYDDKMERRRLTLLADGAKGENKKDNQYKTDISAMAIGSIAKGMTDADIAAQKMADTVVAKTSKVLTGILKVAKHATNTVSKEASVKTSSNLAQSIDEWTESPASKRAAKELAARWQKEFEDSCK